MGKYLGPKCRLCRREGIKLFLKGERCYSLKCPLEKKGAVPPGQHGLKKTQKPSVYGEQLREKQKAKRLYGVSERVFKKYYEIASRSPQMTGLKFLQLLETRLDNVIFKGRLVPSRSVARQVISHGFCLVDGKRVKIPSYQVKPGQTITFNQKGLNLDLVKKSLEKKEMPAPWLQRQGAVIRVERLPNQQEVEGNIDIQKILEFYSR